MHSEKPVAAESHLQNYAFSILFVEWSLATVVKFTTFEHNEPMTNNVIIILAVLHKI